MNLKLYYPNTWKRNMIGMCDDEDRKFNWFLCSKKYKDKDTKLDIAEVYAGSMFYEESTGKSYINKENIKLIIYNPKDEINKKVFRKLFKLLKTQTYNGVAIINDDDDYNDKVCLLCNNIKIVLLPSRDMNMKEIKTQECPLIRYAKENYSNIKKIIPTFSCDDSEILAGGCMKLYKEICLYNHGEYHNTHQDLYEL